MEELTKWIVDLNNTNHMGFAILTTLTMVVAGGSIALFVELIFKILGIKTDKIIIQRRRI